MIFSSRAAGGGRDHEPSAGSPSCDASFSSRSRLRLPRIRTVRSLSIVVISAQFDMRLSEPSSLTTRGPISSARLMQPPSTVIFVGSPAAAGKASTVCREEAEYQLPASVGKPVCWEETEYRLRASAGWSSRETTCSRSPVRKLAFFCVHLLRITFCLFRGAGIVCCIVLLCGSIIHRATAPQRQGQRLS